MPNPHRDYFNTLAPEWPKLMPDNPVFPELLNRFGVSEGDRVLDAGAGSGRMTRHLLELVGPESLVVAQDFAVQMLREGQKALHGRQVAWLCDDLGNLAIKDNRFDKVLCYSVFPHIQARESALREIYRVLKPGGSMLILHTADSESLNAFHASLEGIVRHDRLPAARDMAAQMQQTGFVTVRVSDGEGLYWVEGKKQD
ncbi:class I SAM-dependent methyltransferase [bacterium]|nr:class I SAM-dependent methyltransferase [bacterium]